VSLIESEVNYGRAGSSRAVTLGEYDKRQNCCCESMSGRWPGFSAGVFAFGFLLVPIAGFSWAAQSAGAGQSTSAPGKNQSENTAANAVTRAAIKNVDFHLTDRIVVHIDTLSGTMVPSKQGQIPVFDDKQSFVFKVDTANITLSTAALSNDLNDYVFAKPGAPLKDLSASIKGDQLIVKGLLVSKGGVPFESAGTVSVTPDGQVRVHTAKVKAVGIPVKGLMDLLGIDTSNLLSTKKVEGVSVDKDDLILDPELILPPPQIRGTLVSIELKNGAIDLKFDAGRKGPDQPDIATSCGGRNFVAIKGGTLRFGKLTMNDADIEIVDSQPADPFDFSLDHYVQQLAAGYAKITMKGGLCAHVPDFNKLHRNTKAGPK
jgi:hypothetical protein